MLTRLVPRALLLCLKPTSPFNQFTQDSFFSRQRRQMSYYTKCYGQPNVPGYKAFCGPETPLFRISMLFSNILKVHPSIGSKSARSSLASPSSFCRLNVCVRGLLGIIKCYFGQ